jgi:hypothetical protein
VLAGEDEQGAKHVDVDADGRPLGVEVIGGGDWRDALAALAMADKLRVVPG